MEYFESLSLEGRGWGHCPGRPRRRRWHLEARTRACKETKCSLLSQRRWRLGAHPARTGCSGEESLRDGQEVWAESLTAARGLLGRPVG